MTDVPPGLGTGGARLWTDITAAHDLDPAQRVQLLEACRAKDRLDKLDSLLRGDVETWARLVFKLNSGGDTYELVIDAALSRANDTANLLKQLLAALRLPDASGKRPQYRGPRGAQAPTVPGGKVSSLERARAARSS